MSPEIIYFQELHAIGLSQMMTVADDQTGILWKEVMPKIKNNPAWESVYSLQEYPEDYFLEFNPHKPFKKWALVEADFFKTLPEGFESYTIPEGKYARYYLADRQQGQSFFSRVFTEYLPEAGLELRQAVHFEILPRDWMQQHDLGEWVYLPIK